MGEVEISLFPIPGSVTLPYSTVPLHVFEPRYRKMVTDSIAAGRRIGIAHTQRVISESRSKPDATPDEILNSNQATYLAYPIFSAGFAEIIETFPDGRMAVEIMTDSRYEIKNEVQQIPYKVVVCHSVQDQSEEEDQKLRDETDSNLIKLVEAASPELKVVIESDAWKEQPFSEYSFKIYSIISFEPDLMQTVLELKSAVARVHFLNDALLKGFTV